MLLPCLLKDRLKRNFKCTVILNNNNKLQKEQEIKDTLPLRNIGLCPIRAMSDKIQTH